MLFSSIILFKIIPTLTLFFASSSKVSLGKRSSFKSFGSMPTLLAASSLILFTSDSIIALGTSKTLASLIESNTLTLLLFFIRFSRSSCNFVSISFLNSSKFSATNPVDLKNSSFNAGSLGLRTSFASTLKTTSLEAKSFFP